MPELQLKISQSARLYHIVAVCESAATHAGNKAIVYVISQR